MIRSADRHTRSPQPRTYRLPCKLRASCGFPVCPSVGLRDLGGPLRPFNLPGGEPQWEGCRGLGLPFYWWEWQKHKLCYLPDLGLGQVTEPPKTESFYSVRRGESGDEMCQVPGPAPAMSSVLRVFPSPPVFRHPQCDGESQPFLNPHSSHPHMLLPCEALG